MLSINSRGPDVMNFSDLQVFFKVKDMPRNIHVILISWYKFKKKNKATLDSLNLIHLLSSMNFSKTYIQNPVQFFQRCKKIVIKAETPV